MQKILIDYFEVINCINMLIRPTAQINNEFFAAENKLLKRKFISIRK